MTIHQHKKKGLITCFPIMDVSRWQGRIGWDKVKAILIKSGFEEITQ